MYMAKEEFPVLYMWLGRADINVMCMYVCVYLCCDFLFSWFDGQTLVLCV